MAVLSWGKVRLIIKKIGETAAKYIEFYTPAQDTTELTTTKGDKKEAFVEGGAVEAVKYNKNSYSLAATIRLAKGRKKPLNDSDGIIEGEYEVWLQPEDITAPGMHMASAVVSVEDSYTSEDGVQLTYTFDATKVDGHDQVEWGTVTVTGEYLTPTSVSFTEDTEDSKANS